MLNVLSFGAGVQSTTILLMSLRGVLPKLDHVIFTDTQWEPAAVYRHLDWCTEYAARHGIEIERRTAGNLREDLLAFWGPARVSADGKRHASIPAFTKNRDGTTGMVRRQCTGTYKIEVIERFIREKLGLRPGQRWPLSPSARSWIGISTDEAHRMKTSQRPAVEYWHPLIEAEQLQADRGQLFNVGMSRDDCVRWLDENGFPRPPKSACIGCPFHSDREWDALTPEELADAAEVDRLIRQGQADMTKADGRLASEPYLHRSLVPLDQVVFRDKPGGWGNECGGVCGV